MWTKRGKRDEEQDENHALYSVPRDEYLIIYVDVFEIYLVEIYWKSFYYRDSLLIDWHEIFIH